MADSRSCNDHVECAAMLPTMPSPRLSARHSRTFKPALLLLIFTRTAAAQRTAITDIKNALSDWSKNPTAASTTYGNIGDWNVAAITSMAELFNGGSAGNPTYRFNADISRWNVASVTDMNKMFDSARAFNSDISGWNVAKVSNMRSMFIVRCHLSLQSSIRIFPAGMSPE